MVGCSQARWTLIWSRLMAEKPKITDAEFEVVSPPNHPVARRVGEPILTKGWWWKLAAMLLIIAIATLLVERANG